MLVANRRVRRTHIAKQIAFGEERVQHGISTFNTGSRFSSGGASYFEMSQLSQVMLPAPLPQNVESEAHLGGSV
jgi:hypothetical protein